MVQARDALEVRLEELRQAPRLQGAEEAGVQEDREGAENGATQPLPPPVPLVPLASGLQSTPSCKYGLYDGYEERQSNEEGTPAMADKKGREDGAECKDTREVQGLEEDCNEYDTHGAGSNGYDTHEEDDNGQDIHDDANEMERRRMAVQIESMRQEIARLREQLRRVAPEVQGGAER